MLSNWGQEFIKWAPDMAVVMYDGSPDERKQLQKERVEKGTFNVLVTHYDLVMRDKAALRKVCCPSATTHKAYECLSVCMCVHLSVYVAGCLSIHPSMYLPARLRACLSVVCLHICLFAPLPVCAVCSWSLSGMGAPA